MKPKLVDSKLRLYLLILVGCAFVLSLNACGDQLRLRLLSDPQSSEIKPVIQVDTLPQNVNHIKLNIYLDLATRQALVQERWNRPILSPLLPNIPKPKKLNLSRPLLSSTLIENGFLVHLEQKLNNNLHALGIQVSINSVQAWESSQNGKALSLDYLAHTLRSKLDRSSKQNKETFPAIRKMNVGLVTSPLPSFAQLADLVWARGNVPVVIVNRPLFYYQNDMTAAHTATTRLLIRGIAEALKIAPVCDGGWGGAKRDQLLGLKTIPLALMNQETVPSSLSRDPYLRGAPLSQSYDHDVQDDSSLKPWFFKTLSWSSSSKALWKLYSSNSKSSNQQSFSCKRFELLFATCEDPSNNMHNVRENSLSTGLNPLLKEAGDLCMNDKDSLIREYKKGYLKHPHWKDYKLSAQGLLNLQMGNAQQALEYCQSVANHQPQLLASKCAGLAALNLKKYTLASLYLRAYLSSHPNEVESLSLLAKSLGYEGKDEEALALLKRLASKPKNELKEKSNQIFFNLGIAEARLGDFQRAREAWSKLDPNSGEAKEAKKLLKKLESNTH